MQGKAGLPRLNGIPPLWSLWSVSTLGSDIVEFGLGRILLKKKNSKQNQTNYEKQAKQKTNTQTTLFFDICFAHKDHTALTSNVSLLRTENHIAKTEKLQIFLSARRGFRIV